MKPNHKNAEQKNIIILGGGFAGVRAALDLSRYLEGNDDYQIIVIDRKDYQTYHPALYEAATTQHGRVAAKKIKRTVTLPFADIFGRSKVKVFKAYIDQVDLENGQVVTDSRVLNFTYLVFAMGSIADFYGIPNLDKYGYTLKTLEDAVMIRNRVANVVETKDQGQIVIGGGGFAGAEFAGELHNLIRHECRRLKKDPNNFRLMVVEGATGFLPGLSEKVSQIVLTRLTSIGIETRFSTLITEAGRDYVVLNNKERISCDLLVWTGGVRSCRLPATPDLERDKKDRTVVTEFLNLKKLTNVFVVGDNCCFVDPQTKKPVPQTAQEAIRQGKQAAKNIYRLIHGRDLLPYSAGPTRFVIPVSGKFAIMYTTNLILSGFAGWIVRRGADLRYFVSILPFFKALGYWLMETEVFMEND